MKRTIALALILALLCTALVGCDPCALLYGIWATEDQSTTYVFGEDGEGYTTYMNFPLDFTYTYEDGVLTVFYSETISETGKVTFFGDYQFVWEVENEDGETSQETYYRMEQQQTQ